MPVWDEGVPSFFLCRIVVCTASEGEKEVRASFCRNLRLRIFQRVEFVLSMRVEGVVKLIVSTSLCSNRRTSTCDISFWDGASSPASMNNPMKNNEIHAKDSMQRWC